MLMADMDMRDTDLSVGLAGVPKTAGAGAGAGTAAAAGAGAGADTRTGVGGNAAFLLLTLFPPPPPIPPPLSFPLFPSVAFGKGAVILTKSLLKVPTREFTVSATFMAAFAEAFAEAAKADVDVNKALAVWENRLTAVLMAGVDMSNPPPCSD